MWRKVSLKKFKREQKMRKKILALLCVGAMTFSMTGCDDKKDDKKDDKETTEVSTEEIQIDNVEISTEEIIDQDEPTTEENDSYWVTVGCDRTGYVDVPYDWDEHESTADGGALYSLQYLEANEQGLLSIVDNDYGFDAEQYEVEDPANVVIQAYVQEYEEMGGYNVDKDVIVMDSVSFYKSVDCIPEGKLTDYDYYIYTYVAYTNDRFYTLTIEGMDDVIEDVVERAEETFSLGEDVYNDEGNTTQSNPSTSTFTGSSDWESYEVVGDGDSYVLPCDFSEFEANGWSLNDAYSEDVIEYEDYIYVNIERDGNDINIIVANKNSSSDITPTKGQVVGVNIGFELEGTKSSIAGGITLGMSYNDVVNSLGSPDDLYEDDEDDFKILTYYSTDYEDDYFSMLEITVSDGEVTDIDMQHW